MNFLTPPFDNISIRKKFVLVYIFGICLPLIAGAIIWMAFTSREMWMNATSYLDQTFDGIVDDLNFLTKTAVNIGNQVNADATIRQDLSERFDTPVEYYRLYWYALRNRFNMYLVSNPDIAGITLYIDDPDFVNYDYFRVLDKEVRNSEWYGLASGADSNIVVYPGSTAISITPYSNRITVIRKISAPDFLNNTTNYLLIELKLDRVIAKLSQESGTTDTYITCSGDRIIWSTRYAPKNPDGSLPVMKLPVDSKYYVLQREVGPKPYFEGWKITGVYGRDQINRKQLAVLAYILLITLSLALLFLFLIWPALDSIRYRLLALSGHMKNVRENHMEPLLLDNPGKDEVGWLITAFNDMIAKISELINVVYKLEMQKKSLEVENIRAEYKYLQAQVDPHFLFNTLNAILVFCVKIGNTQLSAVISNLSKLLKRLLVTGDELIPISEEIDFIDKYLSIEKFRFGEKFEYDIQVAPELIESKRLIPRMSIQPIVENACKHGLQSVADDNRRLEIKAGLDGNALVISVKDNGLGMSGEKVEEIMKQLENPGLKTGSGTEGLKSAENGFGIQNVYRRMIMNYAERFHFSIKSSPGAGTEIILRIEEV